MENIVPRIVKQQVQNSSQFLFQSDYDLIKCKFQVLILTRGERCDLLLHTVSNTRVHGGSSRQNDVGVEILSDVNITLHDGIVGVLVDSSRFHSQE